MERGEDANLGGVEELGAEALGDGLDVPEGGLPGAGAQQLDGLGEGREVEEEQGEEGQSI